MVFLVFDMVGASHWVLKLWRIPDSSMVKLGRRGDQEQRVRRMEKEHDSVKMKAEEIYRRRHIPARWWRHFVTPAL